MQLCKQGLEFLVVSESTRGQILATLRWLMDAGADEAIAEAPVDRFAVSTQSPRQPKSTPATPFGKTENAAAAVSLSTPPGMARALAASCTTLVELKAALLNFEGCELKRYATNTVFADGTPQGGIMLIGEAPGREEDREGIP